MDMLDEPIHDEGVMHEADPGEVAELLRGEIAFEKVSFSFEDGKGVIQDISFTIKAGERVAITGPSGSGKSTTINMLPRFFSPTSGTISFGGRDAANFPLSTLRSGISIAFQEVFLFNATIVENLRYARPDATSAEVERACKITGAHKVIQRLPQGYETRLSDYGVELSRGEKQRITLARALLKNSPILILDEATASIDRESSRALVSTVFEEIQNRTIIMITHEANLLDLVDRVVCIRDGQVDYDGPPEGYIIREFGISALDHDAGASNRGNLAVRLAGIPAPDSTDFDAPSTDVPMGYIEPNESLNPDRPTGRFDEPDETAGSIQRDHNDPSDDRDEGQDR
jgi:ABC-type multidrug transport system fused ATPase/permease subunit